MAKMAVFFEERQASFTFPQIIVMKQFVVGAVVLLAAVGLGGFKPAPAEIVGSWKWVHVLNTASRQKLSVQDFTMGLGKDILTNFKADGSYAEAKTAASDNTVSTTSGEWKLEKNGTVLAMKPKEKWMQAKIIVSTADSLIVEMRPELQLVMVRVKD